MFPKIEFCCYLGMKLKILCKNNIALNEDMNEARDALQTYIKSREKFFEDYKRDFEAAAAHLQNYLLGKAQTVSIELARRYRIGLNSPDEEALEKELARLKVVRKYRNLRKGPQIKIEKEE